MTLTFFNASNQVIKNIEVPDENCDIQQDLLYNNDVVMYLQIVNISFNEANDVIKKLSNQTVDRFQIDLSGVAYNIPRQYLTSVSVKMLTGNTRLNMIIRAPANEFSGFIME